ncbi:MAG: hypothetical protein IJ060_06870 [Oscillospiraceae bacterium]|nr:hypothetical protein [Oscillospiraceae bacterium]
MKIIWTKALVQSWFDELTVYTGAKLDYSVVMDYRSAAVVANPHDKTIRIPVRTFNNVDVEDSIIILQLTYTFGVFSELDLPLQQHLLYHTENTIRLICEYYGIPFLTREELNVQKMKISRRIMPEPCSTFYCVGQTLIKKFSILTYTITEVTPLVNDKRYITLSSERETLVLEEEEVVRNYYIMAKSAPDPADSEE